MKYKKIIAQLKDKIKSLEMNEQLLNHQTENFHQSSIPNILVSIIVPIDEKEEFDEESQISLWETDKRNNLSLLNSMNKFSQTGKTEKPFLDDQQPKNSDKKVNQKQKSKKKQLVDNPILIGDSNLFKEESTDKFLEEEHSGHIPGFHQQGKDGDPGINISGIKMVNRNFSAVRKKNNKGSKAFLFNPKMTV
jgi:hypothetical protein